MGILKLLDVSNEIAFQLSNISQLAGIPILCEISFENITTFSSYWNGTQGDSLFGCDLTTELPPEDLLRFPSDKNNSSDTKMGVTSYIVLPKEMNQKAYKSEGVFIAASNLVKQLLPGRNNR